MTVATPTPAAPPDEDEEMVDGVEDEQVGTPQEDDDASGAAQESEADAATPPAVQSIPRRKRLGRPPKNRPPDWNATPEPANDGASESGTPAKRRRGRPSGPGGFRGRPRGGPSHVTRVPIDKEGNMMDVIDDEVALPEDPEGESKVDKSGNLQDGRDYRVRVFTIAGRAQRLYMLSTEPARCTGFRDSYLFFTKHPKLYKIIIDDDEKRNLIDREVIPHSYKGRAIGVVTARSVFREFGARIVVGGKKVVDDYYAQAARERGDVDGEIADLNDRLPPPGEPYNKNQYVAWHGASAVYHTGGPSVPMPNGKVMTTKRKIPITSTNWQFEHAREASRFNTTLAANRRLNLDGVYEPHTNYMFYPKIMQPTHARFEQVYEHHAENGSTAGRAALTNGNSHIVNGHAADSEKSNGTDAYSSSIFDKVPQVIERNFMVTDTIFESPAMPGLGIPGPDGDCLDVGPNGLVNVAADVLAELPEECRAAFEATKQGEIDWRSRWGPETTDGARGKLKIGLMGHPV
ncbi:MAG: hypothetical protein M1821_009395 [Bathelium mastoideum]|nr:MAG: hypothetical protein M1821_009395 [Bathelium mastoideum]KAI9675556.1 MAG: hypothetical protein M1822_008909 [Bathelium mastoideum]